MRTTIVDGRAYECPMYVVRAGAGWQVRVPGMPSQYLRDSAYGGTAGLFATAMERRADLMPITDQVRPLALVELKTLGIVVAQLKLHAEWLGGVEVAGP